jgi:hypothetical protein
MLAPYAEFHLEVARNGDDSGDRTIFSELLTLENVAYLIGDMARDFAEASEHLAEMSKGSLKPMPERVAAMIGYLEIAKAETQRALAVLGALPQPDDGLI